MELTHDQAVFLVVAVVILFISLAVYCGKGGIKKSQIINAYQQQVSKRKGQVDDSIKGALPVLHIPFKEYLIKLYCIPGSYGRHGGYPAYTYVESELTSSNDYIFQIYNEKTLQRISKTLGAQDIIIGNEEFDRAFMIKGSDENNVIGILSTDVQEALLLLKDCQLCVEYTGQKFTLSMPGIVLQEQRLDQLLEASLKIISKLQKQG